jgi:hypothetical protein
MHCGSCTTVCNGMMRHCVAGTCKKT